MSRTKKGKEIPLMTEEELELMELEGRVLVACTSRVNRKEMVVNLPEGYKPFMED